MQMQTFPLLHITVIQFILIIHLMIDLWRETDRIFLWTDLTDRDARNRSFLDYLHLCRARVIDASVVKTCFCPRMDVIDAAFCTHRKLKELAREPVIEIRRIYIIYRQHCPWETIYIYVSPSCSYLNRDSLLAGALQFSAKEDKESSINFQIYPPVFWRIVHTRGIKRFLSMNVARHASSVPRDVPRNFSFQYSASNKQQ